MKIAIIFDRYNQGTLGVYYQKALEKAGVGVTHFWLKDARAIEPSFDAYFRVDDGDYKFDIDHNRLKPSFFYVSDVHLKKPFRAIKEAARFYSHLFCAQYDGYLKLKRVCAHKVSWLPHACDSELHRDAGIERKLDIAFVGNDGGNPRKFILQELRERYPNSSIDTAPYSDISRIYSGARIGFNYSIGSDINMRTFESMAGGAMLLTNRIDGNGFQKLFKDRTHLVAYRDPREIFELIGHYLRRDNERSAIAEAGKRLVLLEHTYDKRAATVLETIRRFVHK